MRVLIVGGGKVGTFIATELVDGGHEVVILEQSQARHAEVALTDVAAGATWLQGDACEVSDLAKAEPGRTDVVVAVTGDDEDNLVVSLLCKQEFGVPRVIARINNPDNEWMFNETWGVDVAVSAPHLLTALVEEAMSVGSLVRLLSFAGGHVRLSEVRLAEGSPAVGKQIQDLELPAGLDRGGRVPRRGGRDAPRRHRARRRATRSSCWSPTRVSRPCTRCWSATARGDERVRRRSRGSGRTHAWVGPVSVRVGRSRRIDAGESRGGGRPSHR